MGKYIDADRLRAEIEKKRNEIVAEALDPDVSIERVASAKYKKDALSDAISIIDSLQEEQPEVDLKKDVESWFFNEISSKINVEHTMYHYFQECAHRYYNRGLNARKEQ